MSTFSLINRGEWEIQREFVKKHMDMGGTPVCEVESGALIRFEYNNPIYHFYKDQRKEIVKPMSDLAGVSDKMDLYNSETPMNTIPNDTVRVKLEEDK